MNNAFKEDIESFTGVPYKDVVKNIETAKDDLEYRKTLWNSMFPEGVNRENIWDYYRSEQYSAYLFWKAMQCQEQPAMPQVLADVIDMHVGQPRILDYGCGVGMIDIGLKNMNFEDITLADIPHKYNKFLKTISNKHMLGFKFIPVETWNEYPLDKKYDFIICNNVLEHVWEPEVTLLHLVEHLEQLGYLYLSTDFNNTQDPSHLEKNAAYQDDKMWSEIVESTGLNKAYQDKSGAWKIWQKTS